MSGSDIWAAYAETVVDFTPPGRGTFRIRPVPQGEVGIWPSGFKTPLFVITAWNPRSDLRTFEQNQLHQSQLEADIVGSGLVFWPAVGRDTISDQFEESFVISGLSEEEAKALGAKFGQNAVFSWTPEKWEVVSCTDERRLTFGWTMEPHSPKPLPR